jgi:membrane protease YdiL (CAAX protease family)
VEPGGRKIDCLTVWKYIFLCFAIVILSCAFRNYITRAIYTSPLCYYFCPSSFGNDLIVLPVFLKKIFTFQAWFLKAGQRYFCSISSCSWLLVSNLFIATVVEEIMYRGPLFVLRKSIGTLTWWLLAFFLAILFSLSHGFSGLSFLPVFILGIASAWLIRKTARFWPCLALHFLYNFQVTSAQVYQALFWGD